MENAKNAAVFSPTPRKALKQQISPSTPPSPWKIHGYPVEISKNRGVNTPTQKVGRSLFHLFEDLSVTSPTPKSVLKRQISPSTPPTPIPWKMIGYPVEISKNRGVNTPTRKVGGSLIGLFEDLSVVSSTPKRVLKRRISSSTPPTPWKMIDYPVEISKNRGVNTPTQKVGGSLIGLFEDLSVVSPTPKRVLKRQISPSTPATPWKMIGYPVEISKNRGVNTPTQEVGRSLFRLFEDLSVVSTTPKRVLKRQGSPFTPPAPWKKQRCLRKSGAIAGSPVSRSLFARSRLLAEMTR